MLKGQTAWAPEPGYALHCRSRSKQVSSYTIFRNSALVEWCILGLNQSMNVGFAVLPWVSEVIEPPLHRTRETPCPIRPHIYTTEQCLLCMEWVPICIEVTYKSLVMNE